jgi:hypothetical protein
MMCKHGGGWFDVDVDEVEGTCCVLEVKPVSAPWMKPKVHDVTQIVEQLRIHKHDGATCSMMICN